MTAEEKKLTSWERSRLDSMPWDKWSERFGISENQIIEKGLGKDLAQGRYTGVARPNCTNVSISTCDCQIPIKFAQ